MFTELDRNISSMTNENLMSYGLDMDKSDQQEINELKKKIRSQNDRLNEALRQVENISSPKPTGSKGNE